MKIMFSCKAMTYSILLSLILFSTSCVSRKSKQNRIDISIFHAGSLSIPMKEITDEFEALYPNVDVLLESSGSITAIRKITDLHRPCDVIALADEALIDTWLIPDFASWNLHFASNEIALVFTPSSKYSEEINADNWYEVIARSDVNYGRSDPNYDPCGYRTELSLKLAHEYYVGGVDFESILKKDKNYIRPKASDLVPLLETGNLDYIFEYTSVAIQHGFSILRLPDRINLSNPEMANVYESVSVEILGKEPGETILIKGVPIVYGLSIPDNALEPEWAMKFVEFFMDTDHGIRILEKHGQKILEPEYSENSLKKPIFDNK